jgi:hypothetical protein
MDTDADTNTNTIQTQINKQKTNYKKRFIMKTNFYSMMTVAILICSLSIFAGNGNNNGNTQNAEVVAFVQMHLDNLKEDIEITAAQEGIIAGLLEKLYEDRAVSAQKADKKEQIAGKKLDYENYTAALDTVLTEQQHVELERKIEERKNKYMN